MGVLDSVLSGVGSLVQGGVDLYEGQQNRDQMMALQQQQWARDDTSSQRKVADLKAAGLAPQLAGGSGEVSSSPIQASQGIESATEGAEKMGAGVKGALDAAADAVSSKSDIARSAADTAKAQADKDKAENDAMNRIVYSADGNALLDSLGQPMTVRDYLSLLDIHKKEADVQNAGTNGLAIAQRARMNAARTDLLRAGLTGEQADSALEALHLREATASEQYYAPWLSPGTVGGASSGAALDLAKGLALGGLGF